MKTILYFQSPAKTSAPAKFAGVRDIAEKAGMHVQVLEETPTRRHVTELVDFWHPIGAIVESSTDLKGFGPDTFGDLPTVFFNAATALPSRALAVSHDQGETGRLAARELMSTGCRNFAWIPFRTKTHWSDARGAAYAAALRLNGFTCSNFESKGKDKLARLKSLRAFLSALPRPCAVFAANDITAEEALSAAALEGLRVPDDLSVLGVDNFEPICEHANPTLSSIEPDFRRGGNLAALLLIAAARDGAKFTGERQLSFGPMRIVRRASTRQLGRPDKSVTAALDLIRREACNGLTAARVAEVFPCSRRLADARFRAATGHSVLEEIHAVQLDRVKQLLADPHRMLKSISDFCGFTHPNSLRKFFRRETGMTLTAWRQALQREATAIRGESRRGQA